MALRAYVVFQGKMHRVLDAVVAFVALLSPVELTDDGGLQPAENFVSHDCVIGDWWVQFDG
jgi:hypothetical protein